MKTNRRRKVYYPSVSCPEDSFIQKGSHIEEIIELFFLDPRVKESHCFPLKNKSFLAQG